MPIKLGIVPILLIGALTLAQRIELLLLVEQKTIPFEQIKDLVAIFELRNKRLQYFESKE